MSTCDANISREELLTKLDKCLCNFHSVPISDGDDITKYYSYYPKPGASSKLGAGGYATAYRMVPVSTANSSAPELVVVKAIPKANIKHLIDVHHLCAELAVTKTIQHRRINRLIGLYHNPKNIYMVLELCEGKKPDPLSRACLLVSKHQPSRLNEVVGIYEKWCQEWSSAQRTDGDDAAHEEEKITFFDAKVAQLMAQVGAKREQPVGCEIPRFIVNHKGNKVPERKGKIVLRQMLDGLEHLHKHHIIHRDMKPENVVMGIERGVSFIEKDSGRCIPVTSALLGEVESAATRGEPHQLSSVDIVGVRVTENIDVKLIDFGHAKYLNMTHFPASPATPDFKDAAFPSGKDAFGAAGGSDSDPFGSGNVGFGSSPAGFGSSDDITVPVTADTGTPFFRALEATTGILSLKEGQDKWSSTHQLLPKLDIFGTGVTYFCMINGNLPFTSYRRGKDSLHDLKSQMERGPSFGLMCPDEAKAFTRRMMHKDPKQRPSAKEGLKDSYLDGVESSVYCYDATLDGSVVEVEEVMMKTESSTSPAVSRQTSSMALDDQAAGLEDISPSAAQDEAQFKISLDDVMAVQRETEDDNDGCPPCGTK